jgi:Glyoxalase/Bleomycin resistance protein/Dioxygenase superfamily
VERRPLGRRSRVRSVEAASCEIFLCRDGQGSRGVGTNQRIFGPDGDESADKGAWMSIWVDDVDAAHERCVTEGLDITHPLTDEPWGVRECHVRHPDGHVFRISQGLRGIHSAARLVTTGEPAPERVRERTSVSLHDGNVGYCFERTAGPVSGAS